MPLSVRRAVLTLLGLEHIELELEAVKLRLRKVERDLALVNVTKLKVQK